MNRTTASLLVGILLLGSLQSMHTPAAGSGPAVVQSLSNAPSSAGAQTSSLLHTMLPRNPDGPWTALCRYFAAYDPEYFANQRRPTTNAQHEPGIRQAKALEETVQVTVDEQGKRSKKAVKERVFGDLAACVPKTFHYQISYLIATVPDPINTHLAMEYDRSLESIERAAAASGFNFDRYWVPWDELYNEHQQDLDKAREVQQDRHLHEEEPGLFVFHPSAKDPKDTTKPGLLLVFLVGETPTYGINKVAFSKALSYIHELNGRINGCRHPQSTLYMAGPAFSGSLDSLALLLQTIARDNGPLHHVLPHELTIVSGSISSSKAISGFLKASESLRPRYDIHFQELTFPDYIRPLIVSKIQRVVGARRQSEIAFLSESTSGYGTQVGESRLRQRQDHPFALDLGQNAFSSDHDRTLKSDRTSEIESSLDVVRLTFPIGIAALRNAYQTAQENLATSNKKREQQLPQVTLPLSYRANEIREQENLPVAATTQTPLSQDAVLQQITRTLRERDIKAVMIFATDSLDSLFLLHYLRETCPNIRIALPGADLLYARSTDSYDFTGTLIFTPYPLFSSSTAFVPGSSIKDPSTAFGAQNKFPSSLAESQFFAVLSLLQPKIKYFSAKTDSPVPLPILWMGVIGKTGYWPIHPVSEEVLPLPVPPLFRPPFLRQCEGDDCTNLSSPLDPPGEVAKPSRGPGIIAASYIPERPPLLWYLIGLVVTLGVVLHSLAVLIARYNWKELGARWWLEYFTLDHGGGRYVQGRAFFLFVATIQVAIAQLVILAPTWRLNSYLGYGSLWQGMWERVAIATFLLGFILALVVAVLNATWVFRDYRCGPSLCTFITKTQDARLDTDARHDEKEKSIQLTLRIVTIVSALLSIAVPGSWGYLCLISGDALPFSDRATAVTSGVCPSLPILLIAAGLYTWAIGSLRRVTYFQNRTAHFPVSHFDLVVKSDFQALRRDLEETLGPVSLPTTGTVWCIVSATFCLFLYRWVGLHSLEPTVFNYVIFAGVCLLWATVLFSIIRLMHIWAVLKKVLRRLERLPIRYAFSRIPSTFSWGPVWQRGGLRRSYLVQARSLEYLRCLSAESAPASQSEAQAFGAAAAAGGAPVGPSLVRSVTSNPASDPTNVVTRSRVEEVRSAISEIVSLETQDCRITCNEAGKLNAALLEAAEEMMDGLSKQWIKGGADGEHPDVLKQRKDLPKWAGLNTEQRQMLAAEFVALRFVAVFRYVSLQMRNLISMISVGFMLALLALKSYPFQPRERIGWWLVIAFICLGAALTYVFMEMDRDATLSRISKTDANKLDREFFWPLLRFGALPLFAIIAAQFPAVSSFLFSWVQPALDSVH